MRLPKDNTSLFRAWKLVGATLVALSVAAAVFVCIPQRHAASDVLSLETGVNEVPRIDDVSVVESGKEVEGVHLRDDVSTEKFTIVKQPKNWIQANDYCKQTYRTELATVRNAADNAWIYDKMKSQGIANAWIGLNDRGSEGSWKWPGEEMYRNWAPGEPNNYNNEDCTQISADTWWNGRWNDNECTVYLEAFVCEKSTSELPAANKFAVVKRSKNWVQANDYCKQTYGTKLATVRNAADNAWIYNKMKSLRIVNAWIGLNDRGSEGCWKWLGEEMYRNWSPGEPNNHNNEDCVHIDSHWSGRWNDNECTVSFAFVCEKPPATTTTTTTTTTKKPTTTTTTTTTTTKKPTTTTKTPTTIEAITGVFIGNSFIIVKGSRNWKQADDYCQQTYDTNLATVSNAADNAWIEDKMMSEEIESAWIGLNDRESEGVWQWADGSKETFTNWGHNEPNNAYNEDCVQLLNKHVWCGAWGGRWNDVDCAVTSQAFVCEKPPPGIVPMPAEDTPLRFMVDIEFVPLNWFEAEDYCQKTYHTHLATIHNAWENSLIYDEMKAQGIAKAWIGLTEHGVWADDSYHLDYENFYFSILDTTLVPMPHWATTIDAGHLGKWVEHAYTDQIDAVVCIAT